MFKILPLCGFLIVSYTFLNLPSCVNTKSPTLMSCISLNPSLVLTRVSGVKHLNKSFAKTLFCSPSTEPYPQVIFISSNIGLSETSSSVAPLPKPASVRRDLAGARRTPCARDSAGRAEPRPRLQRASHRARLWSARAQLAGHRPK